MDDLLNQVCVIIKTIEPWLSALSKIAAAPIFVLVANALLGKRKASMQDLRDVQDLGERKWGQDGKSRAISIESMVSQQNLICLRMHALPLFSTSWMRRSEAIKAGGAKGDKSIWPWIVGCGTLIVLVVGWILCKGDIGGLLVALLLSVFIVCVIYQFNKIKRCGVNHGKITVSLAFVLALLFIFALLFLLLISEDLSVENLSENDREFQIIVSGVFFILSWCAWMFLSRESAAVAAMSKFDGYSALFEDKLNDAVGEYSDIRNTLYLLPTLLLEAIVIWMFF